MTATEKIHAYLDSWATARYLPIGTLIAHLRQKFGWGDRFTTGAVREWLSKPRFDGETQADRLSASCSRSIEVPRED